MLLQSLREYCQAAGGPGSIWKYLEALGEATGLSQGLVCGYWIDLHCSGTWCDGPECVAGVRVAAGQIFIFLMEYTQWVREFQHTWWKGLMQLHQSTTPCIMQLGSNVRKARIDHFVV
jgi:hypothetical protein